jgi:DNA-binding response OmpR family regulator/Tfp pilus assembly protein PilZ
MRQTTGDGLHDGECFTRAGFVVYTALVKPGEASGGEAALYRVRYPTLDDFLASYTKDFTSRGMFVPTSDLVPVGRPVRVVVTLPDEPAALSIEGRITYVRTPAGAGGDQLGGVGMEYAPGAGARVEAALAEFLANTLGDRAGSTESHTARVLVVDDDRGYLGEAVAALSARGHRVETARNGLDGLSKAMREPPDLVVSDVQMPTMDGWQLLRLLRSRAKTADIPVIFLTTLDGEAERLRGYELGVDDYIAKPFRGEELLLRVNRLLGRAARRARPSAATKALRGDLAQVSLASVLQFTELERRSGHLLVVADEPATLHIRAGNVVDVQLPTRHDQLRGIERLFHVLDWRNGHFEFAAAEVDVEDSVGVSTSFALLEHARRCDELGRPL